MSMNPHIPSSSGSDRPTFRFRDVSPSEAAHEELWWYFNEAEIECDPQPSYYAVLLSGSVPGSAEDMERRAEAIHSARKIADRLKRMRITDALLLSGLYTERVWSDRVLAALPGGLAGAAHASPSVRAEYARALANCRTRARSVADFIEEVVGKGRPELLADWRKELEVACAIALNSYERVRGNGPSVVPQEDA